MIFILITVTLVYVFIYNMSTKKVSKASSDLKEKLVDGQRISNEQQQQGDFTRTSATDTTNPIIKDEWQPSPSLSSLNVESVAQLPLDKPQGSRNDEPFHFTFEDFYNRNFYLSGPWNWKYYTTVRGCENFHIYLWIAKDLAWAQDDVNGALTCGTFAVAWCGVLAYHAIANRNMEEIYLWVSVVLWLGANFVWMYGETVNNDDDYVAPKTANIMEAAIAWILFYHIILRPFKLISSDKSENSAYYRPGLYSRFSYFETWRDYENIHTLCWLGKDLCWCVENQPGWIICLIPTLLIAFDFVWETFRTKNQMEDCVHYLAQLMWVIGNMMWALGNVYTNQDGDDSARDMFIISSDSSGYMRYIASWVLFAAYWPIIILHIIWIPMTYMGMFDKKPNVSNTSNVAIA